MEPIEPRRYRRIALATDGSAHATGAAELLAQMDWPAETTFAVVGVCEATVPPPAGSRPGGLPETGVEQDARRYLELVRAEAEERTRQAIGAAAELIRARRPGAAVEEVFRSGEPAREIIAYLGETAADLVVAGALGHTVVYDLLLGSVAEALVTEAPCPALIARPTTRAVERVVVAAASPADADHLVAACLGLPLAVGTRVVAVSVAAGAPQEETIAPETVAHLGERLRAAGRELTVEPKVLTGDVAAAVMAEAGEDPGTLIVVGARERRGVLARLGLGSVSRKLVRRARSAVLVVRENERSAES